MKSDLYPAMELSHQKRARKGNDNAYITLGWTLFDHDGKEILLKDGATAGYSSLIAIGKKKNRGIVVLTNSQNEIKNIACHILDSTFALKPYTYKWALSDTINTVARRKGVDAAIALYRQLKSSNRSGFVFDEASLIYAGHELRKANRLGDAIKLYKFNLTPVSKFDSDL